MMDALREFVSSDQGVGLLAPIVVYWIYSGFYHWLTSLNLPVVNKQRLHSKAEEGKNLVSVGAVVRGVIIQQILQTIVGIVLFMVDPMSQGNSALPNLRTQALQFVVAMFAMDTWQYFMHRLMHESRFLYRHLHSWHHQLLAPYAFGALYNHPLEGLILDTVGGAIAFLVSGMHPRTAIYFFCFATMKTVDDHCGLVVPGNPFQTFFWNNSAYHDIHHQLSGFRYNYSQPFFPFWDYLLGTYMPYSVVEKEGGMVALAHKSKRVEPGTKAD